MKESTPQEEIAPIENGNSESTAESCEVKKNMKNTCLPNPSVQNETKHKTTSVPPALRKYKRRKLQQTLYLGEELLELCDATRKVLGLSRSEFFRHCVLKTLDSLGMLLTTQQDAYVPDIMVTPTVVETQSESNSILGDTPVPDENRASAVESNHGGVIG